MQVENSVPFVPYSLQKVAVDGFGVSDLECRDEFGGDPLVAVVIRVENQNAPVLFKSLYFGCFVEMQTKKVADRQQRRKGSDVLR